MATDEVLVRILFGLKKNTNYPLGESDEMDTIEPKDFTDLTCTNLMIKLKILLKRLPQGDSLDFFATREQVDNTCSPFSDHGYQVSWDQAAENRYLVRMRR